MGGTAGGADDRAGLTVSSWLVAGGEPGRVITGNAGVLVTEVIRVKAGGSAPFVVVDAAMNDLARPAMYDAWHDFVAVAPTGARMTAHIDWLE